MGVFKSRQIGKYQLQAELGRGGFGSVYRAYDPTVGRPVAIKVLTAAGDQQLLNRFKNEAAAAGNLRHKNILTIYDFGEHEGLPYIVMEFLEGEDLQQIISRNRPLPMLDKVSIMLQVADGLHCAHRSGVVHRDVKPANIRLLPDGTVKIMDFGIARVMAGSGGSARLTRQGHVIGTLLYMAPEQVRGGEVDFLCDIFAYGITYYELLTGKHPFQGSDPRTVFYKITAEDPESIRNTVPDCPDALEAIVTRALQKERELRYQSLREVQLDSEPLLIELRQERATSLLAEATRLYNSAQLDSAQSVLNEAFDLDPGNRGARQLRETIQHQLLRRVIEPKVKTLVEKAEGLLKERRFPEAIESFEAALRLDKENSSVSSRLASAREMLSVSREAARLIADARREFARNNLEAALQTLPDALDQDPGNPEARQLLDDVRKELGRREKARENDNKLREAKDLLAADSFDEALRLLDALDTDERLAEEARTLAAQVRTRKQERQRQQKFLEELAVARELMVTNQHEKAIRRLERLMAAYPEEPEATKLFILAHKKLAAQRKGEALERLGKELASLLDVHKYDRALELVNDALRDYPSEQRLSDALRDIQARQEEYRRAEAIREALGAARERIASGSPEAAQELLESARTRFPGEEQIADALDAARQAIEQKRREAEIERLCGAAQSALDRADFATGISALEEGIHRLGSETRLTQARDGLVRAKDKRDRETAIGQALEEGERLLTADDPEQAVGLLEKTLEDYKDSEPISAALLRARNALTVKQRELAIQSAIAEARALSDRRKYPDALSRLDTAVATHKDERLLQFRQEVLDARKAWERSEDVRTALESAQTHLERQQPADAVSVLETALTKYKGESALVDALARASEALRIQEHERAVVSACDTAREFCQQRSFDDALAALEQALGSLGSESRLIQLRDETLDAREQWHRSEAVRMAVEEAAHHEGAHDPESALSVIEDALGRHAGESQLLLKAAELREAVARKRRDADIESAIRNAHSSCDAQDFARALTAIQETVDRHGSDDRLTSVRQDVLQAQAKWEQSEYIRSATDAAERSLAAGDPENAARLLEEAGSRYPGDERLREPLDVTRRALDVLRRDRAIVGVCQRGEAHLEKRNFDLALDEVGRAMAEFGRDDRLEALKARIVAERVAWHRAETVRKALELAAECQARKDPGAAVVALEAADSRYRGESRLQAALADAREHLAQQRRESAIESTCQEADSRIKRGEFDQASETLASSLRTHGADSRLIAAGERLAAAKAARERADCIEGALAGYERRIAASDPDGALETLKAALTRYPEVEQLASAAARAVRLAEEKRHEAAVTATCAAVAKTSDRGEFENALVELERAVAEHGSDPRLLRLRDEVERALAERQRKDDVQGILAAGRKALSGEDPAAAVALLKSALEKYPDEASLREALDNAQQSVETKDRNRVVEQTTKQARQCLKRRDFGAALSKVEPGLATYPDEPRLLALREQVVTARRDWEREQVVRKALSEAAGLQAENHFGDALAVLTSALEQYPSEPRLVTAHGEIEADQQRHQSREAFEASLQDALSRVEQEPDIALRMLETAAVSSPEDARIQPPIERARQLLAEREREKGVTALCQETSTFLAGGDFHSALHTIERGLDTFGDEGRLTAMRETVLASQADWERAEGIRQAIDDADRFAAEGQLETAEASLVAATRVWGPEDRLTQALAVTRDAIDDRARQARITDACREAESALAAHYLEEAAQILEDAERREGAHPEFDAARARIIAARKVEERIEAERLTVADAEELIERNEPERAVTLLDSMIARYPDAKGLVKERARAMSAVEAKRKRLAMEAAFHEIEAEIAAKHLKAAQKRLMAAQKAHGKHARFEELQAEINRLMSQPKVAPGPVPAALPPKAGARRPKLVVLGIAAALGIVAVGTLLKMTVFRSADTGALEIHASPANAIVKIDGQPCSSANCKIDMKPGVHRVEVSAEGYQGKTEETTVTRGSSAQVAVTLTPIPSALQVSANFPEGRIDVNGRPARLQDGQFTAATLEPGRHELRVSGTEGSATLSFQVDTAMLPTLGSIDTEKVEAVALGTFGGQLAVSCFTCSGTVYIDDKPAGEFKEGKLRYDGLGHGTHKLRLTGNSGERNLVVTTTNGPSVNIALTSGKNYGTLVVDTGEDGASVTVDGRRYNAKTVRGQVRLNVDAGSHAVRVAKDGYNVEPPEIQAVVARGDQSQARFRMTPRPARVLLTDANPGASVRVDGVARGVVQADGTFSTDVTPGRHRVELAKDGFATASASLVATPGAAVKLGRQQIQLTALSSTGAAARTSAPPSTEESASSAAPTPPPPAPSPDPAAVETAEWQRASQNPTAAGIEDFLKKYPAGSNAQEARRLLERVDWTATNKNNRDSLQAFVGKHPGGAYASQAAAEIARLDGEAAGRIKIQQDAERLRGERDQIRTVLRSYSEAYAQKDATKISALWPSIPAKDVRDIRASFRDFQSLRVDLQPTAEPEIAGASARVQCRRTTVAIDRNGPHSTEGAVTIQLRKRDGHWVIDSIQ